MKSSVFKAPVGALRYLVAMDSLLFNLLKLALELSLPLQPLLSTSHIDNPPIELFTIHLLHRLQEVATRTALMTAQGV